MADLALELAQLNAQARELLARYDGVFEKLDKETQNKIIELQDKAAELQTQIEALGFKLNENGILVKNDGSEISVGNALKLGGKSLEEIENHVNTLTGLPKPDFDSGWLQQYDSSVKRISIPFNTCFIKVFAKAAKESSSVNYTDYVEVLPARAYKDNISTRGDDLCWTFTSNEVQVWGNTLGDGGGNIVDGDIGLDIRVLAWKGVSL